MLTDIAVNARFLLRPPSGVDRVAIALVTALAARPDIDRLTLLHPVCDNLHRGWIDVLPEPLRAKIKLQPLGRFQGHLWEQIDLARALPRQLLLSLCSTGPVLRRHQAVMIHDAQVWDVPQSYSRTFRLAYRILLPLIARRVRYLLTVSNFSAARLIELGVARPGRPQVVPNGADHILNLAPNPLALSRYGLAPGSYILAIGSLAPHKNLALLVRAASERRRGAPELIVAGGINSKVFADTGLQLPEGIRFIGRVDDAELRALYNGALALAFPSVTEGFGLPPLEAMLCGCPVVATTGGAVPDVCGEAALFVDPTDQHGWTAALERVAEDEALRHSLIAKGKQRAQSMTWAKSAEILKSIIDGATIKQRSTQ